ncbi:MAG: hypothetical protein ACRD26_11845 [Vicinamibacterales bacterium]
MRAPVANAITRLAEWLAMTIGVAPTNVRACTPCVRGFVHGYLGLPYERRRRRRKKALVRGAPAPDPYRQGFLYGRAQRMSRN